MLKLLAALALASANAGPAVRSRGPVEIDLSELPGRGAAVAYRLRLTFTNAAGSGFDQEYRIGANNTPAEVAEVLLDSFPKRVSATRDGAKLVLAGFDGKPLARVEVAVDGVPKGTPSPKVRRLP